MMSFSRSLIGLALGAALPLAAQTQNHYVGSIATGQLTRTAVVNLTQLAQSQLLQAQSVLSYPYPEFKPTKLFPKLSASTIAVALATPSMQSLPIGVSGLFGFNALSHYDQRQANNGNQFSVEPPSPSIAVANGYILEGVNNAVQIYSMTGTPLLPKVLATNQVFGVGPAIDRSNNAGTGYGVFPTDIRVYYDQGISRWFVLQRAQDEDVFGNNLNSSHLYIAVSQTSDPTQTYNVYTMNTTDAANPRCPCIADYPQIGSDQYGFFVSVNEYDTFYNQFVDAGILAISKSSLAAGSLAPTMESFSIPFQSGYEFAIQPATTPPGAVSFLANGGGEYFVSSQSKFFPDNNLALWLMSNTSSLGGAFPSLSLTQTTVAALPYITPDVAIQRPGPLPLGSTLGGALAFLDGGDTRILSVSYAGGKLYTTLATQVADSQPKLLVGGAYAIMSPTFRSGTLKGTALRVGYLGVQNNSLLRPAIAVNAQGKGAISFTLVGPDYFPSAAFIPIDALTTGSTVLIQAPGVAPEDGFTGYPPNGSVARWGDYSAAVAASDGSIWMGAEYIPNGPRTPKANWGTAIFRYIP